MLFFNSKVKIEKDITNLRKSISNPLDLRQLLLYLITNISKKLNLENISFLLYDKNTDEYQLKESIKLNKSYLTFPSSSPLIQYFLNRKEIIFASKIKSAIFKLEKKSSSKKANVNFLKDLGINLDDLDAELAIPIIYDNDIIGILTVGKKVTNKSFSKQNRQYLKTISDEFSQIIYTSMQYDKLRIKEKEMNSLYEVGKVISSLFDFKKTFDVIVRNASILLKAPKIMVLLYDDFESKYSIKKTFGFTDFQLSKIEETIRFKECTQILSETMEGILIKNPADNNGYYEDQIFSDLNINSIISVPLFDEGVKIIGELRAIRPATQPSFNDRDLDIASNLANNIMVALNNSKRYQKSEEHLIELSIVYNITKSLTSEFELNKIQKKVCSIFTEVLNFNRAILYLYEKNNTLIPKGASGWEEFIYQDIVIETAKTLEGKSLVEGRIVQVGPAELESYDKKAATKLGLTHYIILPLLIINKKPIGVLAIDLGDEPRPKNTLNLRLLTAIANQSAIIIENARLYTESEELNKQLRKEQARTAKELQIARYIQQGLLSAKLPESKSLQIYANNIPCQAVGGDFFNFIPFDEKNLGVVIGDVSGKGIPAALLMTMTNSIISGFGQQYNSPEEILKHTNSSLQYYLSRSPIFYVTAFYAIFNFEKHLLRYCKAGHNPPILYRAKTEEIIYLDSEGTYLGTFDEGGYIEKNILIENGDKLVLYTDGITEVRNANKKLFSKERLARLITENHKLVPDKLAKLLIHEVERYTDYQEFSDDLTLLILDFKELPKYTEKTTYKFNYLIENRLEEIKKTINEFLKKLEALNINKRLFNHIRLSISEALLNALEHGNKKDPNKHIKIKGVFTNRKIEINITDEGPGFDFNGLDYSENQEDITHRGRGITAITACMDEIKYNEKGNQITIIKYMV